LFHQISNVSVGFKHNLDVFVPYRNMFQQDFEWLVCWNVSWYAFHYFCWIC